MRNRSSICEILEVACRSNAIRASGIAHALAVVDDLYKGFAGILDNKPDIGGPGVDGVFQQFLDGAGGPLDDLPGGYLVGNIIGQ